MARERVNTSKVIFPQIFINGSWQFVLPIDHIETPLEKEMALDFIAEMKLREGRDFSKKGPHHKLKNRSIFFGESSQDESDDNS